MNVKKFFSNKIIASLLALLCVSLWGTAFPVIKKCYEIFALENEDYAGKVEVVKCNVDDADQIAMQYRIMSIPTLLYFKGGQLVDRTVGLVDKDDIVARLSKLI